MASREESVVEVFMGQLVSLARGVFQRPRVAAGLYAMAVASVFATMDRRFPDRSEYPKDGEPATPDIPPEASILREFENSGIRVVERHFRPGEMIFSPGDVDEQLYFVRSGMVRVYKAYGDYKEATTALLKDAGIFGKLDFAGEDMQDSFAEASTETWVATVRKPSVVWLLKRRPDLALTLFSAFSERLQQSDALIVTLLRREVSSRLAVLLLNLGDRFGKKEGEEIEIDLRLTHMELANMIASTREAVSKAMTELQKERMIDVRNRHIFVLDRRALAERADIRLLDGYPAKNQNGLKV